jgi:hypothetical protein
MKSLKASIGVLLCRQCVHLWQYQDSDRTASGTVMTHEHASGLDTMIYWCHVSAVQLTLIDWLIDWYIVRPWRYVPWNTIKYLPHCALWHLSTHYCWESPPWQPQMWHLLNKILILQESSDRVPSSWPQMFAKPWLRDAQTVYPFSCLKYRYCFIGRSLSRTWRSFRSVWQPAHVSAVTLREVRQSYTSKIMVF